MKILTVSNIPLNESRGSAYIILNYAEGLRARGHEVDVFGPEAYEKFPNLTRAKSHRLALGMVPFVSEQLRRKKYDVLEFYGAESYRAVKNLRNQRRQFITVSHSNGLEPHAREEMLAQLGTTNPDGSPLKWYQKLACNSMDNAFSKADGIVTVSDFDRDWALKRHYQTAEKIVTIENCLSDEFIRLPLNPEREQIIGFNGQWSAFKGTELFKPVITKILSDYPSAKLILIAPGTNFDLAAHFPPSCHERIEVIPFTDRRKLIDIYQRISIFAMPSVYESFSLVAAEAMACGCALVSTNCGFPYSLQNGIEANVLPDHGQSSLYAAISMLLNNDAHRKAIAERGHGRVQGLRWDKAISKLEQTYSKWLAEKRTSG